MKNHLKRVSFLNLLQKLINIGMSIVVEYLSIDYISRFYFFYFEGW